MRVVCVSVRVDYVVLMVCLRILYKYIKRCFYAKMLTNSKVSACGSRMVGGLRVSARILVGCAGLIADFRY